MRKSSGRNSVFLEHRSERLPKGEALERLRQRVEKAAQKATILFCSEEPTL